MNKPILSGHNSLALLDSGVWVKADETERSFIDYTDGASTEDTVYAKVEAAQDRSVYSEELDQAWEDWALEYHLGSKRSNIYRGLNLTGVETVLEVGCGCGAITRFLGEQGFRVDSIEGTMRRAEIARLRTADLENVQIVSSNYHELLLSENSYDLVVFTGVLEYSGAYAAQGVTPEAQLEMTLRHAQAALKSDGQILIAIENRTGFKYLAGASEDHLNVPNIGLLDYPEPRSGALTRGIRTWSKQQWINMLDGFGFEASEFCYPFPDYKVPDAIISDHFIANSAHPEQVLGGIHSRDYFTMWSPQLLEPLFWKTAVQTNSLDEFANSFLIVVGHSKLRLRQTIDFDFVRFASVRRKLAYRMQVVKKYNEGFVRRIPLSAAAPAPTSAALDKAASDKAVPDEPLLRQYHIEKEAFVDGQVLEEVWRQALSVVPGYDEFAAQLRVYSDWLDTVLEQGADEFVDALPRNVIVDAQGHWHLIDQEWHAPGKVTKEIILFRVLFHFALNAREALTAMELDSERRATGIESQQLDFPLIQTFDDFVRWGFTRLGLDYALHREACLAFEVRVHKQVSRSGAEAELASILSAPIDRWHAGWSFELSKSPMEMRVFWTQLDGVWHLDHSAAVELSGANGIHASLELPDMLSTHRFVRIDPAADVLHVFKGWLEFQALRIVVTRASGAQQQVYSIDSVDDLFQRARLKGMRRIHGDRIMLTSDNAGIMLDLDGLEWGENIAGIKLNLEMDICSGNNIQAARQALSEEALRSVRQVRLRQHILDRQQQRLDDASERLQLLENKIEQGSTTALGKLLGRFGLMRKYRV